METTTSAAQNRVAHDDRRRIDTDRIHRALTGDFAVVTNGPKTHRVARVGHEEHLVDIELATCDCEDAHFRDVACIHLVRAAVHHAFVAGVNTRFVARVLRAVRAAGCVHDARGCSGPCGVGTFPCPSCVRATSTGDWTVWLRLVALDAADETGAATPRVATDGGTAADHDGDATPAGFRVECAECSFVRVRADVLEADELGGAHSRETGHFTGLVDEPGDLLGGDGR